MRETTAALKKQKCFELNFGTLLPLHTVHLICLGGHAEQQLLHSTSSTADLTFIISVLLLLRE